MMTASDTRSTYSVSTDSRDAALGKGLPADAAPPLKNPGNEEPAMLLEADLPTDGRDEVGEAMIRNLPRRRELSEPPSQADANPRSPE